MECSSEPMFPCHCRRVATQAWAVSLREAERERETLSFSLSLSLFLFLFVILSLSLSLVTCLGTRDSQHAECALILTVLYITWPPDPARRQARSCSALLALSLAHKHECSHPSSQLFPQGLEPSWRRISFIPGFWVRQAQVSAQCCEMCQAHWAHGIMFSTQQLT